MTRNTAIQFVDGLYCVYVGFSYNIRHEYEGKVFYKDEFICSVNADDQNECAEKGFAYAKTLNDEPTNYKEVI